MAQLNVVLAPLVLVAPPAGPFVAPLKVVMAPVVLVELSLSCRLASATARFSSILAGTRIKSALALHLIDGINIVMNQF